MQDSPDFDRSRMISYLESQLANAQEERVMGLALARDADATITSVEARLSAIRALPGS